VLSAYVAIIFALGLLAVAHALHSVAQTGPAPAWFVLAALVVGSQFTTLSALKFPGISAHLSVSEILVFMTVLICGPAAAVVTVAVEGLVFSLRQELGRKRNSDFYYAAFDFAEPAVSIWVAAHAFSVLLGTDPAQVIGSDLPAVALPALVMSVVYFAMNSGLSALAEALSSRTAAWPFWKRHFKDLWVGYLGSVSIAAIVSHHLMDATPLDIVLVLLLVSPLVASSFHVLAASMRQLEERNRHVVEIERLNLTLAEALAMTAEAKDQSTSKGHIRRVRSMALQLARAMGVTDPQELQAVEFAGLLHDYGKTAIPDHLLNKPGRLTDSEYEVVKSHASAGADMIARIGFSFPVVPIIRHHHENWDGSGYPGGLQGDAIPRGARVLAVVDCYDALRDHRPYRRALSHEQAMAVVRERSGTAYDPAVVEAFASIGDRVRNIAWMDPVPSEPQLPDPSDVEPDSRPETVPPLPIELRLSATSTLVQLHDQLSLLDARAGVKATCGLVAQSLLRVAPAGLIVFYRRDEAADELVAAYAAGFGEALARPVRMSLGHKVSGWVAANGRSVINADPTLDLDDLLESVDPRFRSLLSIPLPLLDRTIGVVTLYAIQDKAFREEQREAISLVRHAIGQAFWRAIQNDQSGVAPTYAEGAPGPANRRALEALLAMEDLPAADRSRSTGVLCVQISGGSRAMPAVTMAVTEAVRVADLVFAPADDALVVLMRDADTETGRTVARRILEALPARGSQLPQPASALRIGYASSPHDGDSIRQLLDVASRRLNGCQAAPASFAPAAPRGAAHTSAGGQS
jgi:putative nucleotidyltransferase with HDIG domain